MFVHQTKSQRILLGRYENSICLLDANYKTTKYWLPLFFVVVKTNVNYQVVASFVLQDETTAAITEALSIVQIWNPTWERKWFIADNCDEEIKSIGHIFSRTYTNCFYLFVLIKNLFIVQKTMHFWKHAKKYQEWFVFKFK